MIEGAPRVLLSAEGRKYREDVQAIARGQQPMHGRLRVTIDAFPPDRRRRDVDNLAKAALDALTHAGVWGDDSQVDELLVRRADLLVGGSLVVTVEQIEQPQRDLL